MRKPRRLLTKAKAARVAGRKAIVRGKPLNPPAATAAKYSASLHRLVDAMTEIARKDIEAFFARPATQAHFAQDESVSYAASRLVSALEKKFAALFDRRAEGLSEWLVNSVNKASTSSLHASLQEMSGGLSMKTSVLNGQMRESLSAATAQNVGLIKSIPEQYLHNVEQAVLRSVTTGNGLADLQPMLEAQAGITKRRAKMIAEDQTHKIYSAINRQRMDALGLTQFEWLHSGGGKHPRELHVSYSGKVFKFSEPPVIDERTGETGLPGDAPNCRCKMIPVLSSSEAP
jgi:SPP1 gp7 family putative phage head morphogenesis protein